MRIIPFETSFKAAVLAFLVTAFPALFANIANAENWGHFKKDECTYIGLRQYSAVLHGIPWGKSWETACESNGATINGKFFPKPSRCVNSGTQMWGQFDVPVDSDCPRWGDWRKESCEKIPNSDNLKGRRYSARMWDAPKGATWQNACAAAPVNVGGLELASPMACRPEGNRALISASVRSAVAVASASSAKSKIYVLKTADVTAKSAEAIKEIYSAVQNSLENQNVPTSNANIVDKRSEWTEMWGVVWIPEKGCGL